MPAANMGQPELPEINDVSSEEDDMNLSDEEGVTIDGIYIPPAPAPYCSSENKGPRLMIYQIVNNFFKSYASNVVLGPFHKAFSAIIGPNGSGKSNVIDSMLFVFGFRANKMRSKKMSVLIHNSPKYRNVQNATVAVHFRRIIDINEEEYETVPNSEFVVSRTINKDNSSFYMLNNRKVHFKEVATLLKTHGIDLKYNRFLILQGEVEQIAMMPAIGTGNDDGMLEYLEDIIGTTRYKEPLIKLNERVEEYWEKRIEKANRLKIVQDEVELLREPMEQAVEFLKIENDIAREKNTIYQYNIYAIKTNMKDILEQKEGLDMEMEALKEKLNSINREKKGKTKELEEITKKYEIMEKRKEALKEGYDKANSRDVDLQMHLKQTNDNRHKYKKELEAERKKLETYQRQPKEIEEKIGDCEKAIKKLIPKAQETEEEKCRMLASMKDLTRDLQIEKDVLTEELGGLMKVVNETNVAYSVAESELKLLTSNSDREKENLQRLEATHEEIQTKIEQLGNETEKLQRIIPSKQQELEDANNELPGIKQKEEQLLKQLMSSRSKVEESKASMNASRSKNRVLDALRQQKVEGNIPGYYGRLGDLGSINAKYDVAISTACGPLDNIVVDSIETGQWCIEFLKSNDIGRVTVIVLELQQHLLDRCNSKINTPENVYRLFDLIEIPDERFRPAFYYAIRDTLVASDLDQASRIAYGAQRFRVVTLNGEMIETSGAMSGGGNRVLRGRMGQSVQVEINPEELADLERDLHERETNLTLLRQQQGQLENIVQMVQPELRQMRIAFEKMNIELKGFKQREPVVSNQIQEQRKKVSRVSINLAKVSEMQDEVNIKKAAYDEASEEAKVIKDKVDKLTKEITEKSQGKIRAFDTKLKETNKNIDKLKAEVTKLKVSAKTSEKNAVKSEKAIELLEADIKAAESTMLEMRDKRLEIEQDAEKLIKMIEELTTSILDGSEEFTDLKNEVKELDKTETKLRSEKIELDQKVKTAKENVNTEEQKIDAIRVKLSHLKLQEIPTATIVPFQAYTDDELEEINVEDRVKQVGLYEIKLKALKPNLSAIDEYRKKNAVVIERSKELDEVLTKWQLVRKNYDDLRHRRKEEFMTGYRIIRNKLKEMYQMVTIGGDADFELVDTYDPFSEGVALRVRPPRKTWKHVSNLSGGEKTLSSLALVFALHYYKPSPLYVLDEIDAALDFKNVSIISNYIKQRTKNAQFIIISLRHEMFELCCHLVGIGKPSNTTISITIDPRKFDSNKNNSDELNDSANAEMIEVNGSEVQLPQSQDLFSSQSQKDSHDVPLPQSQDIFSSSEISSIIMPSQE